MKSPGPVKSSETGSDSGKSSRSSQVFEISPRTTYVKPPGTNVDIILRMPTSKSDNERNCVDHGTDAGDLSGSEIANAITNNIMDIKVPAQFHPLFGIVEELVVHLSAGEHNEVFESVIRSYKHGGHQNSASHDARIQHQPASPTSFSSSHGTNLSSRSLVTVDTDEDHTFNPRRGIIPGNSHYNGLDGRRPGRRKEEHEDSAPNILDAGRPAQLGTPSLGLPNLSRHFRESFSAITNAVGVQNSIRALLNVHFPPKSTHYRQHIFPLENDRFWKPVFSNDDGPGSESKTVELILALGMEEGVDQNFCNEIAEHVEKLGIDRIHGNRTRKLDIR
jgi:hypothetical protein